MAQSNTERLTALGMPFMLAAEVARMIEAGPGPVSSVNGQSGTVVLGAANVGALPDDATPGDIGAWPAPTPVAFDDTAEGIAAALVTLGLMDADEA